jgi:hypothetical protein
VSGGSSSIVFIDPIIVLTKAISLRSHSSCFASSKDISIVSRSFISISVETQSISSTTIVFSIIGIIPKTLFKSSTRSSTAEQTDL